MHRVPWSGRTLRHLLRWQLLHGNRTACLPSVRRPSPCCQSPSHQMSPCTTTSILITHLDFRIHRSINISITAQIMMLCDGFIWVQFVLLLSNVDGSWQIKLRFIEIVQFRATASYSITLVVEPKTTPQSDSLYKNLAIANRSRVSSAHNTLRALIGLNITPWPWNLG